MEDFDHDPTQIPTPASYHWTPRLQREFLEHVAVTGSVRIACDRVGMSPTAAYQLKQRPAGAAFRLGWAAAVLIARGRIADELLDRAIYGHEETTIVYREEERSLYKRRRIDSRLGLAMLARLDRMVETRARAGEEMLAQVIAGDWPGFLSLFDVAEAARAVLADTHAADDTGADRPESAPQPGMAAALALWLAARDNRANPLASLWQDTPIANEVAQFSADPDRAPLPDPTPEEEAEAMTVWHDEEKDELRTNFPPPGDFLGDEEGQFGDPDYERTLDPDEIEAYEDAYNQELAPLRAAGEAARRAFFGFPEPANDREGGHENVASKAAKTRKG
ncbi:hypothetical protein BWQ93_01420 [Sphingopyxis sp. QXT-31]|uniref:hypothetical protein n=1 Tax=Sphingopyxis sp. QXT-31 TaxID=1357916 RepID=UPI0009796242|nr:hypothetical protein [Sphingopyxis sp. QXT-31]APZ97298.1 hypothetical protein BWQ93_01420 [Sphingopyxis sp. QXT-31]